MPPKPKDAAPVSSPDVGSLLNEVLAAVTEAKAKADVVETLRSDLSSYTAKQQAKIETAMAEYTDAKIAADRLQAQARDLIGQILPAPDPRFRVTT